MAHVLSHFEFKVQVLVFVFEVDLLALDMHLTQCKQTQSQRLWSIIASRSTTMEVDNSDLASKDSVEIRDFLEENGVPAEIAERFEGEFAIYLF